VRRDVSMFDRISDISARLLGFPAACRDCSCDNGACSIARRRLSHGSLNYTPQVVNFRETKAHVLSHVGDFRVTKAIVRSNNSISSRTWGMLRRTSATSARQEGMLGRTSAIVARKFELHAAGCECPRDKRLCCAACRGLPCDKGDCAIEQFNFPANMGHVAPHLGNIRETRAYVV
jgi:hypothetical protein